MFLNHNIKGHGTYIRCYNLAKHLVRFGHSVVILTSAVRYWPGIQRYCEDGVQIISMPDIFPKRYRNGGLGPIDTLLRCLFLANRRFDIVENYDHRPAVLYPALAAKYLQHTPLVSEWTDLHGDGGSLSKRPPIVRKLIGTYENFSEIHSKKLADHLVVISQGLMQKAQQAGIPESKITYIPGGSDLDNIKPRNIREVKKQFNLPLNQKIVAFTGGTHYDMEFLISVINEVQTKMEDVIWVTSGARLKKKRRESLLFQGRVIELGFLPYNEYTSFLSSVDVFMFPFIDKPLNRGRWPNKIGDYLAAGRPIVTHPTGDMIHIFKNNDIGLLASELPGDFAAKTMALLSNKSLRNELGRNARAAAKKNYDWKILAKKLENCFLTTIIRGR